MLDSFTNMVRALELVAALPVAPTASLAFVGGCHNVRCPTPQLAAVRGDDGTPSIPDALPSNLFMGGSDGPPPDLIQDSALSRFLTQRAVQLQRRQHRGPKRDQRQQHDLLSRLAAVGNAYGSKRLSSSKKRLDGWPKCAHSANALHVCTKLAIRVHDM